MAQQFNISYPAELGVDGKIVTSKENNRSRIRFLLDFIPGQRPHRPTYGSLLGRIEQDSIPSSSFVVDGIFKLRTVLFTFASKYFTVDEIAVLKPEDETSRTVEVDVKYIPKL